MDIKSFPKVELHLHLDGSIRIDTACELSGLNKSKVKKMLVAKQKCQNLADYLQKFDLPNQLMQSQENLTRIAKELVEDLKKDNVIYAEVRFALLLHMKKGLTEEEVVEAVLLGLKDEDLQVNLILCMMRQFSFEDNLKTIELASKYLNKGVVALDLAGDEASYKTADFKKLFEIINKKGLPFTIHAGEADGKNSLLSAIEFGAKRIGHGVRCIEDEEVLDLIYQNNITLEVCPTSNIQTNTFKNYQAHPIKKLYDSGLMVTVNTDNRTVSNITLTEEYAKLIKYFSFNIEDFKKMNVNAIKNAFISNDLKDKYQSIISNFKTTINKLDSINN